MNRSLLLRCDTLQYYCPAWQECVRCSEYQISVGNHALWIVGSSASVITESFYVDNATILNIYFDINYIASVFDVDFDSRIDIMIYVNNNMIFYRRIGVTGKGNSRIVVDVGKKVSGNVFIKYDISVRADSGYFTWVFSYPTVVYEYNPPSTVARLHVETYPSGATVYIDGKNYGKSPVTADVSEGYHEITAELTGYRLKECYNSVKTDSTCRVYANAGEVNYVSVELEEIPAPSPVDAITTTITALPHMLIILMIFPVMNMLISYVSGMSRD